MTSSYKFHDGVGEIVPHYARYQYPTQANKAWKTSVKIPPKNGSTFSSQQYGASINIDLPAQGYLHCANSTLSFDVEITPTAGNEDKANHARFQNNIQSVFDRMRLTYGSLLLEDLRKPNVLVRMLTEATGNNVNQSLDQSALTEGIGGMTPTIDSQWGKSIVPVGTPGTAPDLYGSPSVRLVNTRVYAIQSLNTSLSMGITNGTGTANTRRYTVQLPFGIFQQNKLLPLKWMASQLTISLDLAPANECMVQDVDTSAPQAEYTIKNMFFNAELIEYDSSYDAAFLEGIRNGGVPIKFASWNTYVNSPQPSNNQTILIPERNRSLKALFTVQCPPASAAYDSHAMLQSSGFDASGSPDYVGQGGTQLRYSAGHMKEFHFRIGGKYWPSTPVQCGAGDRSNGAAEAYIEYAKALNVIGDYRLHSSINPLRWSRTFPDSTSPYKYKNISIVNDWSGWDSLRLDAPTVGNPAGSTTKHITCAGPSMFVVAANLESSTGGEISGLNGEEQNDIALMMTYSSPQSPQANYYTFVYYDALLVLRENNLVELIK